MPTLVKPNGTEVEVNERSLSYALSLGWKEKKLDARKKKSPVKKSKEAE